ncbi:hypothetical protein [Chitinophaga deserti]|uniref:hypothetical protein n=1 Tax=Chitinophaga deserti TaxID=2164099 RepID=UPI00130056D3|nr:hypothetical protein [Chitinophaga deserti]
MLSPTSAILRNRMPAAILFTLLLITGSCKKNPKEDNGPGEKPGPFTEIPADMKLLVTPKAAPTGNTVTAVIGPAGGTLASEDGNIAIEVPAGAVAAATTFSIRPVENTLQKRAEKTSYELLPHSVKFNKPVKITMNYDMDVFDDNADALQVASRDEATGQWIALPTALDKDEGTLTVEKSSFSLFEFFEKFMLFADDDALDAGESTQIRVGYLASAKRVTDPDEVLLAPLVPNFENNGYNYYIVSKKNPVIENWLIIEGPGTIAVTNQVKSTAKYTAPATLTDDYAIVQVTLTEIPPIIDPKVPGGVRNGGKMYLREQISLLRAWIKVGINGQEYYVKGEIVGGSAGSKTFGIGGSSIIDGVGEILVSAAVVLGKGNPVAKSGSYPFGIGFPGGAIVSVNIFEQDWVSGYHDCDAHTMKPSSGKINYATWGTTPGTVLEGSTTFTAYHMTSECDKTSKSISLSWHIPL